MFLNTFDKYELCFYSIQSIDASWIRNKDVLDVGCNDGTLTCQFARELGARSVVGVDIDSSLVHTARQRVRVLVDQMRTSGSPALAANNADAGESIPASTRFPSNISFVNGDFVLRADDLLDNVQDEYDTVVAFSITKWVHVNNGDAGLRRFFKRCYRCLRPGGRLLLEAQPWSSYERRKCTVLVSLDFGAWFTK
jgi:7SK snRNA methylphosphate capping enzyme